MFLTKGLVEELVFVSFFFLDLCRALASTRTASPAHLLRSGTEQIRSAANLVEVNT